MGREQGLLFVYMYVVCACKIHGSTKVGRFHGQEPGSKNMIGPLGRHGVSWPSGLAYRTQVLVLAAECGFESRP